jgi:hypothetical protein
MTSDQASRAIESYLASSPLPGVWSLDDTGDGWLVVWDSSDRIGRETLFVDNSTGALLSFPSSVPPRAIRQRYHEVRNKATDLTDQTHS